MALSAVLTLAVWCAALQTARSAGALLPSYQLLLPYPAGAAASVAAPASRVLVLLPGGAPQPQPQPLAATALDAAHQQVEAASARVSQLPPQPSRADFQARAQVFPQQQLQQQEQQQQQQQQQQFQQQLQLQQLQEDSVAAARANFQVPVRGRPDFQQQAARQQQSDYQVVSDGRGEFSAPAGPQPMRPSGLGRALQTPSYQALVADYRFRQQQLQQQASSYQPLATEYQYRQPQRAAFQAASSEYQYRQQPAQLPAVSSPASRADYRPGPYPLPTPYSSARANLAQQQQQQQQQQLQQVQQQVQQQDYQQQQQLQQQDYQQQGATYEAPRSEFRSLQPQGLLPGQEYSVNFEGDGFGYGYTIRGDHNLQRAF